METRSRRMKPPGRYVAPSCRLALYWKALKFDADEGLLPVADWYQNAFGPDEGLDFELGLTLVLQHRR